ncbi:MAG TPA: phage antirepressor N-terminal domain-containing protein [Ardenticatenaceae bacterium]|jgi:hypothetical protein
MDDAALVPQIQKQILFYGDQIVAVQMEEGSVFVPIRQMCELLGIGYQGQIDRIRRDAVLQKYEAEVLVANPEGGGAQATNCLALKYVPGWLFGITASRVREEVREKLILYQEQVYDIIWQAFRDEVAPLAREKFEIKPPLDELAAIEQMGLAIYRLARQQRAMEARLDNVEDTLWEVDERTRGDVERLRGELNALELRLAPPAKRAVITETQAAELSQAVKTVAMAVGKQSGRNEFGGIYGELYRRFGITSYRNLPATAFQEAMEWLESWFRTLSGGEDNESNQ